MLFIWAVLVIEVLALSLLKSFIGNLEIVIVCLILINSMLVVIGYSKYKKGFREFFFVAYALRTIAMFWDLYARNVYILPHSGGDSERFLYYAQLVSSNLYLLKDSIYGGVYTKFLGILFHITGPERILAQYINVLLGVTIIVVIYRILIEFNVNNKTAMRAILLVVFLPHAIIFSGILLRENLITIFLVISFYYFSKWYKNQGLNNIIFSILFLLMASSFHSGIIGIIIGYFYMYLFYSHKKSTFMFTPKSVLTFVLILILGSFVYTQYSEVIMNKFNRVDNIADLYSVANYRSGGSAYLLDLRIDSLLKMIIYAPIFMIYFLISPVPMNWRGLNDALSFFMDSSVYLILSVYIISNFKRIIKEKPLLIGITIMLIFVVLIFGIGVKNAGTAIRHRHKIYPIFIILYALISDSKTNKKDLN